MQLTVGFDLDMTLVDTRAGIHACALRLGQELGVDIDADLVVSRLGVNTRSTIDTLGVGTRTEEPSSLPFSSGSTNPTARSSARRPAWPCRAPPTPSTSYAGPVVASSW